MPLLLLVQDKLGEFVLITETDDVEDVELGEGDKIVASIELPLSPSVSSFPTDQVLRKEG